MRLSLIIGLMVGSLLTKAQSWDKTDSLKFDSQITCLCTNYQQEVYLGLSDGTVIKLNKTFKITQEFSIPNTPAVANISCANPLKLFVFYENNQSYTILERFNANPVSYSLSGENYQRIELAALAADQSIWTISNPDMVLQRKMLNTTEQSYRLATFLTDNEALEKLLDYQNQLLLLTNQSLHYFNLAGQWRKKVPLQHTGEVLLSQKYLSWLEKGQLKLFDLLNEQIFSEKVPDGYQAGAMTSSGKLLMVNGQQIDFYLRR